MALFGGKKRTIDVDGKKVELEPKPGLIPNLFGGSKPSFKPEPPAPPAQAADPTITSTIFEKVQQAPQAPKSVAEDVTLYPEQSAQPPPVSGAPPPVVKPPPIPKKVKVGSSTFKNYLEGIGQKHKGLEASLRAQGVTQSLYEFVRNMLIAAAGLSIAIGVSMFIFFQRILFSLPTEILLTVLTAAAVFVVSFQFFMNFPTRKSKLVGKTIERDILFAARDLIISLRSGMPLFNAITSVSSGYGESSKEFAKIVEKVQLGAPLEDAIDQTVAETKSQSFRRIMLQAAVSIRAGADVTQALQSVIDQLSQERVIELRRYGQRLNALAMFYMLFGIILPSMGIAVITIMTTFISIFSVNTTVLEAAIVGIFFLQLIFLELITSSRPVFSM